MDEEQNINNPRTANDASALLAEVKNTDSKHSILIIGGGMEGKTSLLLQTIKEKYGQNVEVITIDEAEQRGFKAEQLEPVNKFVITAPPIIPMTYTDFKSGKESRRERRLKERNANKKHKW